MPAHETPVFDEIRDGWDDRVTAWDLGKRPVRRRVSDSSVLDPDTAIVADSETTLFRALIREHPDPAAAEQIAETQHQLDLERAAQPPVIEVTVTTPPEGIRRADLARTAMQAVRRFTGPQPVLSGSATNPFPAVRPGSYPPQEFPPAPRPRRRGKVLQAVIRRPRRRPRLPELPPPPLPVSEDDMPTQVLPAVVEVRIP